MTPRSLRRLFNVWPPFLFAGIRIEAIADDWRCARARLKLRWYNRNYVGTAFGGSLFALADPFWMILAVESLGRDYVVWDKSGEIEFIAPGRSDVIAEIRIDDVMRGELRAAAANGDKVLRWFEAEIRGSKDELIAKVRKQLYVRLKRHDAK